MSVAPYRWTGTLRKDGDGIAATITDTMGCTIALVGTRTAEGYALVGVPGLLPEWLALPGDTDEPERPKPPRDTTPAKRIPPPKPGASKMLGDVCPDCCVPHGAPACGHDSGKACPGCGKPIGLLTKRMTTADACWRCERVRGGET